MDTSTSQSPLRLDDEQWKTLLRDGVLYMPGAFSAADMAEVVAEANKLFERYPFGRDEKTLEPHPAISTPNGDAPINHLVIDHPVFQKVAEAPLVVDTVERVLGKNFRLHDSSMRRVPPGAGRMDYHIDQHGWFGFILLADDIGWDEGGTALVAGTHVGMPAPLHVLSDIRKDHPREIQATGKPGDLYFFFYDIWHSRGGNVSGRATCELIYLFRNKNAALNPLHRHVITPERIAKMTPTVARMSRPFDGHRPALAQGPIGRWIFSEHNPTRNPFVEFLYDAFAYRRAAPPPPDRMDLPSNASVVIYHSGGRGWDYLRALNWRRVARFAASSLLNRFAAGRALLAWVRRRLRAASA